MVLLWFYSNCFTLQFGESHDTFQQNHARLQLIIKNNQFSTKEFTISYFKSKILFSNQIPTKLILLDFTQFYKFIC